MSKDRKLAVAMHAMDTAVVLADKDEDMDMMQVRDAVSMAKGRHVVLGFTPNLLMRSCGPCIFELFSGVYNASKGECSLDLSYVDVWPDTTRSQLEGMLSGDTPSVPINDDALRSFDVIAGFDDRVTTQSHRLYELMPIVRYLVPCFAESIPTVTKYPGAVLSIMRAMVHPCRFFVFHDDSSTTMRQFEHRIMNYLDDMTFRFRYPKDWERLVRGMRSRSNRSRWNIRKWYEPQNFLMACLLVTFDKQLENPVFPLFRTDGDNVIENIGRMLRLLVSEWAGRFYEESTLDYRILDGFEKTEIGRYANFYET